MTWKLNKKQVNKLQHNFILTPYNGLLDLEHLYVDQDNGDHLSTSFIQNISRSHLQYGLVLHQIHLQLTHLSGSLTGAFFRSTLSLLTSSSGLEKRQTQWSFLEKWSEKCQQVSNIFFSPSSIDSGSSQMVSERANKHTNQSEQSEPFALHFFFFHPGLFAASLHHHRRCGTSWVWWWVLRFRITSPASLHVQMNKHAGDERRGEEKAGCPSEMPLFMERRRCSISDRGNALRPSLHSKLESCHLR